MVTFKLPRYHDNHNLSTCYKKELRWKNANNGAEGVSDLTTNSSSDDTGSSSDDTWTAEWAVPPEIMTAAGQIDIAISIYDIIQDENQDTKRNLIAFSWNTPKFSKFSIGESLNQVADIKRDEDSLPARNEILMVDIESRSIIAPKDWNPILCSYGDIGISKVFFEVNQYIYGMDLTKTGTIINVGVAYETDTVEDFPITNVRPLFKSITNKKSNKVLLTWDVPENITNNGQRYTGNIFISLKVYTEEGEKITKRWTTSQFNKLIIDESVMNKDATTILPRDESIINSAAIAAVDAYFESNEILISSENEYGE